MSATQKSDMQKKVVIGLAAVFFISMLKNLGLIKLPALGSPQAMGEPVNIVKPLSQTFSDHWNEMTQGLNSATSQEAAPSVAPKSMLIYSAQSLRDPLASLLPKPPAPVATNQGSSIEELKPVEPPPQLLIKGIWWEGGQPKALINNEIYGIGESIGGAIITAIGRDSVTLDFHGETLHASIPSSLSR